MAKYLFQVSYTAQGAKGLLADAFVTAEIPDHASASAISLAVSASGGARCKTIVLLTPEEVDQASKKPLTYTGPGR